MIVTYLYSIYRRAQGVPHLKKLCYGGAGTVGVWDTHGRMGWMEFTLPICRYNY